MDGDIVDIVDDYNGAIENCVRDLVVLEVVL